MKKGIYIKSKIHAFQKTGYIDDFWNKRTLSSWFCSSFIITTIFSCLFFIDYWKEISYFFFDETNEYLILLLSHLFFSTFFITPAYLIYIHAYKREEVRYDYFKNTNDPKILKECLHHYKFLEKNKNIRTLSELVLIIKKLPDFLQFLLLKILFLFSEINVTNNEHRTIMNSHFHYIDLSYLFIFTIQKDKIINIQK